MMMREKKRVERTTKQFIRIFILLALFVASSPRLAVAQYSLDEKVSFVNINGTSTMHDWSATAKKIKGTIHMEVESNHILKINSATISIPTKSLKSSKDAMDKNMYKALKADNFPEIKYQLKSHIIHNGTITTVGELTIAGVTKTIESIVSQKEIGQYIKIEGKEKIKMTDFNIKPPEFLFGSFKTGDEITVTFHFMFNKKK